MINKNNFMGLDGFVWWFGIVENRRDPLTLGRCQVRVFGWHTEDKNLIPTADLPWAHPIIPLGGSSSDMVAPKEGEMVFGFFMDSDDAQFPVMMGIVPGIPAGTPKIDKGFSDPRTRPQLNASPKIVGQRIYKTDSSGVVTTDVVPERNPAIPDEPTVSRLARNEKVNDTFIGVRKETIEKNVLTADESYWSEPETKYAAEYPFNHVYESESGHIMEFDDTPGSERIHMAHRTGTFDEIFPNGTKVSKVVRDKYEVVMSDNNLYVMGDCNITINGKGKIFVRGDATLKVGGNMTTSVKGTYEVVSTGNMTFVAPRIDLNPPGVAPTYIETTFDPTTAVLRLRQVPGANGSFIFAGVELQADPYIVKEEEPLGLVLDNPEDTTPNANTANAETSPPVTCGDFSEPLTEADYSKRISTNYTLKDLSIGALYPHRINAQNGLTESEIACNLQALAENCIEAIRARYPGFRINSGFRVRQNGKSQHEKGQAADLQWSNKTPEQLKEIAEWARANIPFDQLIYEIPSGSRGWLHVSFSRSGLRKQVLTWKGGGYIQGIVT